MGKIIHIVLLKLRKSPSATHDTEDPFAEAKASIGKCLNDPNAESMFLGPPMFDVRAKGFDYGLYSVFASRENFDTYAKSEAHANAIKEHILPHIEDSLTYDFELPA